ncbi:hypothetical protein Nmel_001888 [Mimus melanotis]
MTAKQPGLPAMGTASQQNNYASTRHAMHSGFKVSKMLLPGNQHLFVRKRISIARQPRSTMKEGGGQCQYAEVRLALFSAKLLPKSLVQDSSLFHKKRNKGNLTHNTK